MERRRRGRGQGPGLHLKLSNEIYNKKKKNEALCSKDQIKFLMRHLPSLPFPPLPLFPAFSGDRQTEERGLMGSVT